MDSSLALLETESRLARNRIERKEKMETNPEKRQIPTVVVPYRVLKAMVDETMAHPLTETGHAMVGIETASPLMIVVLGVVPDIEETMRHGGGFRQGGDDQVNIFRWLAYHWERQREASRQQPSDWQLGQPVPKGYVPKQLDCALGHLGDWHRHPGGFGVPSTTDRRQAEEILHDQKGGRAQLLMPIVTISRDARLVFRVQGPEVLIQDIGPEVRIRWFYASRELVSKPLGGERIIQVPPVIVPNEQLPWLPPVPWHLMDPWRLRRELASLKEKGCQVGMAVKEMGGDPLIREICFGVDHPDWKKRLLIITSWDYPRSKPVTRVFPKPAKEEPEAQVAQAKSAVVPSWLDGLSSTIGRWIEAALAAVSRQSEYVPGYYPKGTLLVDLVNRIEGSLK